MEKFQDEGIFDYEETEAGVDDDDPMAALAPTKAAAKKKEEQ